jgi:hypothetical protein
MRKHVKRYLSGLALLVLALPVWAHTYSVPVTLDDAVTISGKQLGPGQYQLQVKDGENQLRVVHEDKTVAEVPCEWIQLPKKSNQSDVILREKQIVQVDFEGKTMAIEVK